MADKNRCIDEKIRSSLLTYILTNEELRCRFILTPNKIEYCATEAMKYLAIYDDYVSHMVILIHIDPECQHGQLSWKHSASEMVQLPAEMFFITVGKYSFFL